MDSREWQQYVTADGSKIDNMGEKRISATTAEGSEVSMTFQIAQVTKPLGSVGKMCDAGNQLWFTKTGGEIWHEDTGTVTAFTREQGVYLLEAWAEAQSSAFAGRR